MHLTFIGINPPTGSEGSPTVWVDEDSAELVFQREAYDVAEAAELRGAAGNG